MSGHYAILIMILLSGLIALLGQNRKMGFWGYFFASILFTPVIGLLLVLASDPRPRNKKQR
jgi:hypothetical protein